MQGVRPEAHGVWWWTAAIAIATVLAVATAAGAAQEAGEMVTRPDYAKLSLHGDGMKQDSFSLALQAAARMLGREADYETIAALTTNAFSPAINPGENCTSWWHVDGYLSTTANLQPLAARLGLRITRLPIPWITGDLAQSAAQIHHRREVGEAIGRAMEEGAVVVVEGGWQSSGGPHGFVPWGWAGIVTEVKLDGALVGACLNGQKDNPLESPDRGSVWAIRAGETRLDSVGAGLAALRQAVARIRGTDPFQRTQSRVYGLEAMDLWIKQMEEVPGFCAPCQERSQRGWSDAADNAVAFRERAGVAASYLRGLAAHSSPAARAHLEAAATHYDRIAQLLTPALTGEGGEKFEQFVGDLKKQQAYAAAVLRPAKAELATAADEMAQALAQPLPEAVVVRDVPGGKGEGHEFARGLEVVLAHAGAPADYDTLMGDLGLAFMLQASDQAPRYGGALDVGWWPLEPVCVPVYLDFVGRTVGRRIDYVDLAPKSAAELPEAYRKKVQARAEAALRAGHPFVANYDFWEVVTGYDRGEPPLLGFCPAGPSTELERLSSYPWAFAFLGEARPKLDRRAADREALQHAVALGRDQVRMPQGYVTGQKAFALWASTLRDTEHLGQARWHWNTAGRLASNRGSAIIYLRAMAARQPAAAPHLEAAAKCYEQTLARLKGADLSEAALMSAEGRMKVALVVEEIARGEVGAVEELGKARAALQSP